MDKKIVPKILMTVVMMCFAFVIGLGINALVPYIGMIALVPAVGAVSFIALIVGSIWEMWD